MIREATLSDVESIHDLLYGENAPENTRNLSFSPEYLRQMIASDRDVILVHDEEGVKGMLHAEIYTDRKFLFFNRIVVSEAHRRKGIASGLFKALESLARDKGISRISSLVYETNDEALKLHSKLGFEPGDRAIVHNKEL